MKFYKMRHKPTGLFYKPSKYHAKWNLSEKGKVYQTKPTVAWLGDVYYHPRKTTKGTEYETRKVYKNDWEIVSFEVPNA